MKVAVVDNIDSFVYNLVQYLGDLGTEPHVFRNDSNTDEIRELEPERIVISPGPKAPEDSGISPEVVRQFGENVPILGVCLGHQIIAHAFGGNVVHSERLMHGKTSMIRHNGGALYENIPDPFEATRYHSLAVEERTLPECLRINARTSGDTGEIMGIRHRDYPVFGVQFHPESILTSEGMEILKNFLEMEY